MSLIKQPKIGIFPTANDAPTANGCVLFWIEDEDEFEADDWDEQSPDGALKHFFQDGISYWLVKEGEAGVLIVQHEGPQASYFAIFDQQNAEIDEIRPLAAIPIRAVFEALQRHGKDREYYRRYLEAVFSEDSQYGHRSDFDELDPSGDLVVGVLESAGWRFTDDGWVK